MLLSKKHNFIFIHIPKVAGQSVTNALMPHAAMCWQRLLSPVIPYRYQLKAYTKLRKHTGITFNPQPFHDHIEANEIVDRLGLDVFKSYYSFAFVRNPWAWALSQYTYAVKNPRHTKHAFMKQFNDFDEYIRWHCKKDDSFYLQKSYVCDSNGTQLVNYIGKQEKLSEDFAHVCKNIGIGTTLPKFNVSRKSSYKDHYTNDTKKLVETLYEEDIEYFKYSF
ncbi:MAG: sulfotransferase family 2 domain-containing protein [Planctomycetes bacterium]|nr:sulfotransferase family 2 domain-containing protein [Planctomycetota bacterium]